MREETRCHHIGYSLRLTARVLLYESSHRQDNGLCYTSCGALAGMRNSSMGPPWRIDPTIHRTMCDRSYHRATSTYTHTHKSLYLLYLFVFLIYSYIVPSIHPSIIHLSIQSFIYPSIFYPILWDRGREREKERENEREEERDIFFFLQTFIHLFHFGIAPA